MIRRVLVIFSICLGLAACDQQQASQSAGSSEVQPVSVTAVPVMRQDIVQPIVATGTISALRAVELGPLVDGVIEKIDVVVGDRVKKGDALFHTRKVDYELMLEDARHRLDQAVVELEQAERDRNRAQTLRAKGAGTNKLAEDTESRYRLAKAQVGQADTALKRAKQNLKDVTVYAPYDGVIVNRYVDEGVFKSVRGGMGGMSGMSGGGGSGGVVRLLQIDIVAAIVNMPEVYLSKVKLGTPAVLTIEGIAEPQPTVIHVINDLVSAESRTVELRLGIENPDYVIKPGLFVSAELTPAPHSALVLPRKLVQGGGDSAYVYVEENGHAKIRKIRMKDIDADRIEILSGLTEGEIVMGGDNLATLYEGVPVSIVAKSAAATDPNEGVTHVAE